MYLPEFFKLYLRTQKISSVTAKNYLADINHFLDWLAKKTGIHHQVTGKAIFGLFTQETIEEYKSDQVPNTPLATINRRLSALRKFGQFAKAQGWIRENPVTKVANVKHLRGGVAPAAHLGGEEILPSEVLADFQKHLQKEKVSPITIKNYLSDLRHFLGWLESG